MSMEEIITMVRNEEFEKHMNPPQPYVATDEEICLLDKLKNICSKGFSAEVKLDKKGCFKVYEVRKSAI